MFDGVWVVVAVGSELTGVGWIEPNVERSSEVTAGDGVKSTVTASVDILIGFDFCIWLWDITEVWSVFVAKGLLVETIVENLATFSDGSKTDRF